MGKLLSLVVLILNIMASLDLFKSDKDTTKKIIWALVIWLIPVVGLILYYVMGKKQ